ncbi:MAG: hypothetical protein CSYNP_01552 [Syntrophus sp. SKADARSKE-3]|nr:hypothetical protein [Syntrophus sp. SKADARSKE-3]
MPADIIKHINMNYIQIVFDIILCGAILFSVWRMSQIRRKPLIDRNMLAELQQLIANSHAATASYLQAVNEGRKSAKEVAYLLADREKRAKELLDKINKTLEESASSPVAVLPSVGMMAAGGMAPGEIARATGINEGEVKLMIGLAAKKGKG